MRNKIIQEILKDEEIMKKYGLKAKDVDSITTSGPYYKKIVEVIATIINENANDSLSNTQLYKKIKNIHKI